jgi:hypothetical protein
MARLSPIQSNRESRSFNVDRAIGKFRIRLSAIEPSTHLQERGIHEEAVRFHANALNIAEASDGVKAFTGIITQIVAGVR